LKLAEGSVHAGERFVAPRGCAGRGLKQLCDDHRQRKLRVAPRGCAGRGLKQFIFLMVAGHGASPRAGARGAD